MNNSFEDAISDLVIEGHVRDGYAPSEDELRRIVKA